MGLFCSPSQSLWAQAQMTAVLDLLGTIASIFVVVWVSKLLKPPSWMKTEQITSPLSYRDLRKTAPWDANSTRKLSGSWFAPSFFLSKNLPSFSVVSHNIRTETFSVSSYWPNCNQGLRAFLIVFIFCFSSSCSRSFALGTLSAILSKLEII